VATPQQTASVTGVPQETATASVQREAVPTAVPTTAPTALPAQSAASAAKKLTSKVTGLKLSSAKKGQVTVKWSTKSGKKGKVTGYQLSYQVKGQKAKVVNVKGAAQSSRRLSLSAFAGKKVTIRLRTYQLSQKTTKVGKWSAKKTVMIHQ
jgi:hypothetical protein